MINGEFVLTGTVVMSPMLRSYIIIRRNKMDLIPNITPGEILLEEFLIPMNMRNERIKIEKELKLIPQAVAS
jgi:hypothetical protein